MTDELRLTYTVPREMMLRAIRSWGPATGGFDWMLAAIAAVLLLIYFVGAPVLGWSFLAFFLGMGSGIGIVWLKTVRRHRKVLRTVLDAQDRAGPKTLDVGPDGLRIETAQSLTSQRWTAIDRVIALDDATVLLSGGTVLPVPDAALPEGVAPSAFRARIEDWRTA